MNIFKVYNGIIWYKYTLSKWLPQLNLLTHAVSLNGNHWMGCSRKLFKENDFLESWWYFPYICFLLLAVWDTDMIAGQPAAIFMTIKKVENGSLTWRWERRKIEGASITRIYHIRPVLPAASVSPSGKNKSLLLFWVTTSISMHSQWTHWESDIH